MLPPRSAIPRIMMHTEAIKGNSFALMITTLCLLMLGFLLVACSTLESRRASMEKDLGMYKRAVEWIRSDSTVLLFTRSNTLIGDLPLPNRFRVSSRVWYTPLTVFDRSEIPLLVKHLFPDSAVGVSSSYELTLALDKRLYFPSYRDDSLLAFSSEKNYPLSVFFSKPIGSTLGALIIWDEQKVDVPSELSINEPILYCYFLFDRSGQIEKMIHEERIP